MKSVHHFVVFLLLAFAVTFLPKEATAQAPPVEAVVLDTPSELIQVEVMVKGGSAYDPEGREGLAYLTARLLLEGSYGDPRKPTTKEQLAETVRPWGSAAKPSVVVEKETATFSMTIPRGMFPEYMEKVLRPLFTQPIFSQDELDRVRRETLEEVGSTLRLEDTELLGLYALDNYVHDGTSYAHLPLGSVQGLKAVTRDDVLSFYKAYYVPDNIIVALNTSDTRVLSEIQNALQSIGKSVKAKKVKKLTLQPPPAITGRHLTIVIQPGTIASGIHAGFPVSITRTAPDYWALYVANIHFGTHRDGFGKLYNDIREARGYNYGDYSYIEWFADRTDYLFPPTNTPRRYQYFSIWIRPVAHQYVHHILKAATWELESFIRQGMTAEECELAKNKAKVLYLNLAETGSRLLAYKLDDAFYGMSAAGYLDHYVQAIDRLTPEEVNRAIRKYLQAESLKYIIVTDEQWADRLKDDIASDRNSKGKDFESYNIDFTTAPGDTLWQFPKSKIEVVQMDKVWESYWLDIPRENIHVVPSSQLFETGRFIAQ